MKRCLNFVGRPHHCRVQLPVSGSPRGRCRGVRRDCSNRVLRTYGRYELDTIPPGLNALSPECLHTDSPKLIPPELSPSARPFQDWRTWRYSRHWGSGSATAVSTPETWCSLPAQAAPIPPGQPSRVHAALPGFRTGMPRSTARRRQARWYCRAPANPMRRTSAHFRPVRNPHVRSRRARSSTGPAPVCY